MPERVRALGPPAGPDRAPGAAEIVLPDAGTPSGLRELVTTLGRYGASATPTRPAGPRWGDLAVDTTSPGEYRILVKAVCQGRIAYGPAIALRIPLPHSAHA